MKTFSSLPKSVQQYINQRFGEYGISGKDAYESDIFPEELKDLQPDELLSFLKYKNISHIKPQKHYPDISDNIGNVILEDEHENKVRSDNIMTDSEKESASKDLLEDLKDEEDSKELNEINQIELETNQ